MATTNRARRARQFADNGLETVVRAAAIAVVSPASARSALARRFDPYGSGSARSCCSRRRSPRSFPISIASWPHFPPSWHWLQPTSTTCSGIGKAWAIIAAPGRCMRGTSDRRRARRASFPNAEDVRACRALAATRRGPSFRSPSTTRAPILEANTVRLFSRLIAHSGEPSTAAGQKKLWQLAEQDRAATPLRASLTRR